MGLFNKIRNLTGSVPKELLEHGLLGRGIIVGIQQTSVSTGADFDPAHVCVFTVEVALDDLPRYNATCRQAVRATILPQLMTPGATVGVRVDAAERVARRCGGSRLAEAGCTLRPVTEGVCRFGVLGPVVLDRDDVLVPIPSRRRPAV